MEKLPSHSSDVHVEPSTASSHPLTRRDRVIAAFGRILGTLFLCFAAYLYINDSFPAAGVDNASSFYPAFFKGHGCSGLTPKKVSDSQKVQLEAHVMSKCPDARDCLQQLVVPVMEKVSDLIDFNLSFIANVSNQSSAIECKHGPEECIGDILILCAANLPFPPDAGDITPTTPHTPVIRSLGFANCLIGSYSHIPEREFVEQCALEHGIDFNALNECASQQEDEPGSGKHGYPGGIALLRESALHSAELDVSTSCTVRLDESVWCVRDDGLWVDCTNGGEGSKVPVLVDEVKRRWEGRN